MQHTLVETDVSKDMSRVVMINATKDNYHLLTREFLPLFHTLSFPTDISSKSVLTVYAISCLLVSISLQVHTIKRLAMIQKGEATKH